MEVIMMKSEHPPSRMIRRPYAVVDIITPGVLYWGGDCMETRVSNLVSSPRAWLSRPHGFQRRRRLNALRRREALSHLARRLVRR